MRIRDLTESTIDEGPVWNKVKAGVKKIFAPGEKKHPLVSSSRDVKQIFAKLINGQKLDNYDMSLIKNLHKQI